MSHFLEYAKEGVPFVIQLAVSPSMTWQGEVRKQMERGFLNCHCFLEAHDSYKEH